VTVLPPQFTARNYIRAIDTWRCSYLTSVPPMIAMMLRERALLDETDLSSVRYVRMGSAPVSGALLDQIHASLPNAKVINAYLLGPSGCGKSTLPKVAAGLIEPTGGHATIGGRQLERPGRHVGVAFQKPNLLPWKTVLDNVMLPARTMRLPHEPALRCAGDRHFARADRRSGRRDSVVATGARLSDQLGVGEHERFDDVCRSRAACGDRRMRCADREGPASSRGVLGAT
jgi:ABC-type transport system involved in cytochrome bd biosynthesis fused ATPase/permease subunit